MDSRAGSAAVVSALRHSLLQPTRPMTGVVLLEEAARAVPAVLMTRLAEALNVALGGRILPEADATVLKRVLREAVNAWALSVSRFLEVQDEMRVILERGGAGRAEVDWVMAELETVFIALWTQSVIEQ
jgi:hypothetical protein